MRDLPFPIAKRTQSGRPSCPTVGCTPATLCVRCTKSKARTGGLDKQRKVLKRLEKVAGPATRFRGQQANEESWRFPWRCEVKSGKQVTATITAYENAKGQAPNVIGDPRPFVLIVADGPTELVVLSLEDFQQLLE